MKLIHPDNNDLTWSDLTPAIRDQVRVWINAFNNVPKTAPISSYFAALATYTGQSQSTAKRHYYALQKDATWSVLVPQNKLPKPETDCRTNNKEFRTYLVTLAEKYQRSSQAAFSALRAQWRRRDLIPGYEDFPGHPAIPTGWKDRNLARIVAAETTKTKLASIRFGVSSKTNPHLPQVFTTRVGLYPGAVYQLDDMWHDNFVTVGKDATLARVIELGALDLFSGCRFHWGAKPRLKNETTGSFQNLNEADARLFLCGMLHQTGYSPRGTMIMVEHGTAAVREDVERILYDATGGLIRLDRQPIEGKQQALAGYWNGTEGGNFRAKAALESLHNKIHNDLAHLSLQTGKDASHRPVSTDRQLHYISSLLKRMLKKAPERRNLLRLPSLDFHSQFVPLLTDYYHHGLNTRTDHNLEGWNELGHIVTEYTALPGSDQFLTPAQFVALPEDSRAIISKNAIADAKTWSRKRNLSPWEVWQPALSSLHQLPDYIIADILGPDLSREEKVKGSFFTFRDRAIGPEKLHYSANILTRDHARRELPNGQKYQVFCNPFEPRWLFVYDAKGHYLGKAELVKKVSPINQDVFRQANHWEDRGDIRSDDLKHAAGEKHQRIADQHQDLRIRHEDSVSEAKDLRDHNKRIEKGDTRTDAQRKTDAAEQGARTRTKNKATKAESRTGMTLDDLT